MWVLMTASALWQGREEKTEGQLSGFVLERQEEGGKRPSLHSPSSPFLRSRSLLSLLLSSGTALPHGGHWRYCAQSPKHRLSPPVPPVPHLVFSLYSPRG